MCAPVFVRVPTQPTIWLLICALVAMCPSGSSAITPDTPRVKSAVQEALKFLESAQDGRVGGKALIGLAFTKNGADDTHPKVADAIKSIKSALKNGPESFRPGIYDTGVAIMFLVATDPSKYRFEIESLVKSLHLRQKDHGAWGYPLTNEKNGRTCDTSMTQYAVLGLWEAEDQAGVETPRIVWERVARWLLLTQDPGGGFGYQGIPSGLLGNFEKQSGVRDSMSLAAVGSIYIVKDRVGITQLKKAALDSTPDAFVLYESQEERAERIKTRIDPRHFTKALSSGNRWIESNVDVANLTGYPLYGLYALERYESLREAEKAGRSQPVEKTDQSKWYNRGAKFLLRTQSSDGSWEGKSGVVPSTAFGALFLMGSTRKTLEAQSVTRYTSSNMVGGKGIPANKNVRLRDGQVVQPPLDQPLAKVLRILRNTKHPNYASALETLADAANDMPVADLAGHLDDLSYLAASPSQSAVQQQARLLAIKCLSRTKDLDHVPWLIHLLADEDTQIAYASAEALGEVSRKFDTLGMSRRPTDSQRDSTIAAWRAWFAKVRPDVDLDSFSFLQPGQK